MAKHNCSLDALGEGSCDCTIYKRKGSKLAEDKKLNDANSTIRGKVSNRYDRPRYDKIRRGSDPIILPIGSARAPDSSQGVPQRDKVSSKRFRSPSRSRR